MANNKKIIICPDSFKGTISSIEAADIIADAVQEAMPLQNMCILPIADGGEGTLECFRRAVSGTMMTLQTRNSNFKPVNAEYFLSRDCAIIESAKAIGLPQTEDKNPLRTTSYGVGQLIEDALQHTQNIILALGGSSTNDGGCGMAAALGAKFYNEQGKTFIPTGATLRYIKSIDVSAMPEMNLTCMCDVKNPLYGDNGAAYVFAPQKGASLAMVRELDDGLIHLSDVIKSSLHVDVSEIEGGGAAGGIAAGMVAFSHATLKSGIEVMLDAVNFDGLLNDAKLVVTGEGKLDSQTMQGKAVDGIIKHSNKKGVPVIAICGQIEMGFDLKKSGLLLAIASSHPGEFLIDGRDYKNELRLTALNLFKKLSGKM